MVQNQELPSAIEPSTLDYKDVTQPLRQGEVTRLRVRVTTLNLKSDLSFQRGYKNNFELFSLKTNTEGLIVRKLDVSKNHG